MPVEGAITTYYAVRPITGDSVFAVLRIHADSRKLPEVYRTIQGWVEDSRILLKLMSGDLGPADIISEKEAFAIVGSIDAKSTSRLTRFYTDLKRLLIKNIFTSRIRQRK